MPYEKPFINRQRGGITNKFGDVTQCKAQDNIEGVLIADLTAQYGSPLMVYSERVIREKHREMMRAFSTRYPKAQHAWSYKTNYLKAVCKTFHTLGSWAEVVSTMEYEMARKLGMEPSKIIFNGPFKPYEGLQKAITEGAIVNIDNLDELYDIEKIVTATGKHAQIGIRVNMALGGMSTWDRFGFNLDDNQAHQAIKRIVAGGKVQLAGIHAHVGTFILETEIYRQEAQKLVSFCAAIKSEFGITIKYLDIGGGFASRNRLKGTYLSTAEMIPSFSAYADAICSNLLDAFTLEELPILFLESGRAMIDEAGSLISTVQSTKRLPNGMKGLVIDAGVNILFTSFWYNHEVIPTVVRGYAQEDYVIYGPLCMQIDVIREQVKLPPMEKGDRILIQPVGAYNNTQWMQFITLRPNVVMISENGEVEVIREAETVDYMQQGERIPEWLKN
ncbi:MAG: alanine racemase [Chlorobiales bacterium]|nr:alanine racemase [Chlorobiales bacterium]